MQARASIDRWSYDRLAEVYDEHWSVHVREPQRRLTRELALEPGLRCADLGCGTGMDTVEMARAVAPGEVVAVDCSEAMLKTVGALARAEDLSLTGRCADAGEFILGAEAASYDVITSRFCLGYLDWRTVLPRLPRLLRPGGRLGLLTILASSAQQAYSVYEQMARTFGLPVVARSAPASLEEITAGLQAGGGSVRTAWTHCFQLKFASGNELGRFLRVSGLAAHPLLEQLAPAAAKVLWARFAELAEAQRIADGIPLDFELAGVTASA